MSIAISIEVDSDIPSGADLKRAMSNAVTELIEEADKDFDIIKKHDPKPAKFTKSGRGLVQSIYTVDKWFTERNQGFGPYTIFPKVKKALRFEVGTTPRTTPNQISSQPLGHTGDFVIVKHANHPGIDARNHEDAVADHIEEIAVDVACKHIDLLFS